MRFEFITAVAIKEHFIPGVITCRLLEVYGRFGETYWLRLQREGTVTRLYDVTFPKYVTF